MTVADTALGQILEGYRAVVFAELRCSGSADMVVASLMVHYAAVSAEGAPLRAMDNRLSWGLKRSGPLLRIVHEHSSAPVGFGDMKALLHRPATA